MLSDIIVSDSCYIINNINNKIIVNDSLIYSLNERLSKLEETNSVDSNTITTLIVTVILFLINAYFVEKALSKDKKRSIMVNISEEFNNTEKSFIETNTNSVDNELITMELEKVLNFIEIMCYHYMKKDVDVIYFDFRYKQRILAYYDSFPEYYGSELTPYNMTMRYVEKKPNR